MKCGKYYEKLRHRNNARYGFCPDCFDGIWKDVESGEYKKSMDG